MPKPLMALHGQLPPDDRGRTALREGVLDDRQPVTAALAAALEHRPPAL